MSTQLGVEVLFESRLDLIAGQRIGLVACPSSVDHDLQTTVDRLHQHPSVDLVALFGPEHGLRGDAQAGKKVRTYTDSLTNLPVYSLYGETRQPTAEMFQDLDIIVIDLQDGGVRFYTFLATTFNVMVTARNQNRSVVILDRPAPITAKYIEGPILDPKYASFVGPYPVPIRYGMTLGEIACLVNEEFSIHCDLTVVPLQDWSRDLWFDQTDIPFIPSSPNLPTLSTMTIYPGSCLIEGTNLSEGRGTTRPFEYIGAPWLHAEPLAEQLNNLALEGVRFRPVYFVPTFSKYAGELCAGVHIFVSDRECFQPLLTILHVLQRIKQNYPDDFEWRPAWSSNDGAKPPIDLLCGGNAVRKHLNANRPITDLVASWQASHVEFLKQRVNYMLYPLL